MDLYHNDMSVCAQKVRMVTAEKRISPVLHHLDIRAGDTHTPQYLALNPKGVVPTLVDAGQAIIESTVICEYLDDAYPQTPLRPDGAVARAAMRRWTMLPDAGLHIATGTVSFAIAFRHQEQARQTASRSGKALERWLTLLSDGLEAPFVEEQFIVYDKAVGDIAKQLDKTTWLAGDTYSLADIAMVPYICRLEDLGQSWLWLETPARSSIGPWLTRCKEKLGYSNGIALFLNQRYLKLMRETGVEARPVLERMLAAMP